MSSLLWNPKQQGVGITLGTGKKIKHIITALKQAQENKDNKGYRWIIKAFPYYTRLEYWDDMTEKEKTRIENRFYEFAQSLISPQKF